jgi:hypothetical protein
MSDVSGLLSRSQMLEILEIDDSFFAGVAFADPFIFNPSSSRIIPLALVCHVQGMHCCLHHNPVL